LVDLSCPVKEEFDAVDSNYGSNRYEQKREGAACKTDTPRPVADREYCSCGEFSG
jgi:hypothetical protein